MQSQRHCTVGKSRKANLRKKKKKLENMIWALRLLPNGEGEQSTWKGQKSRPTGTQTKHNE